MPKICQIYANNMPNICQVRKQTFKREDKGTYIYLLIDLHENKREKKDKLTSLYIIM